MASPGKVRLMAACSAALGIVGAVGGSTRGSVIDTSPAMIDGWTISWPTGIELDISQDPNSLLEVDLQKSATFTAPDQGYQITFVPTPGQKQTADEFLLEGESIDNSTGDPFADFSFILLNSGTASATIVGDFKAPSGSGYSYSGGTLVNDDTEADYSGVQNAGATSVWGGSSSSDHLTIDAPAGSIFSLKELSIEGTKVLTIPEPAAAAMVAVAGAFALSNRRRRVPVMA